jgi:ATP-dependent DNA helicase RecQ
VLTGSSDERISKFGHDQLSVFGIVGGDDARVIKPLARALQARGALIANEHGGLKLSGDARAIMRGEQKVEIAIIPQGRNRRDKGVANPIGDPLFEALRSKRRELAEAAGVPPYVVFHDATLREMASSRPSTVHQLSQISGVGSRKLDAYGAAFLDVIKQH